MVDLGMGLGRDDRLGAVGDAQARGLDHRQVVGAVADRQRVGRGQAEGGGFLSQRGQLGFLTQDRLADRARQPASFLDQGVGAVQVEARRFGDP
jgi:hypothetical protein